MEGELPVKEVLRDPDKYEKILMTEEETPECMLKYIYPDRYKNNSLVLNGALFPDMSLSLGDLNGDHQTDLTDLSILFLRLLGETESGGCLYVSGRNIIFQTDKNNPVRIILRSYLKKIKKNL